MSTDVPLNIQKFKDVVVVNLAVGSILDTATIDKLGAQLYDLVDSQARKKIVLDFSEVKFLSSSALGMLLKLREKSQGIKGRLLIAGMREELLKVFRISRLDKLFEFHPNEERALNVFGITTMG